MHTISGTFVKDKPLRTFLGMAEPLYPLKLALSFTKARVLFFTTEKERFKWKQIIFE